GPMCCQPWPIPDRRWKSAPASVAGSRRWSASTAKRAIAPLSMTGHAFVESRLAGGDVLRERGRCCCGRCDDDQRAQFQFFHVMLFVGFGWLYGRLWHGAVAVDKPTKHLPGFTDLTCLCGKAGMAGL